MAGVESEQVNRVYFFIFIFILFLLRGKMLQTTPKWSPVEISDCIHFCQRAANLLAPFRRFTRFTSAEKNLTAVINSGFS